MDLRIRDYAENFIFDKMSTPFDIAGCKIESICGQFIAPRVCFDSNTFH